MKEIQSESASSFRGVRRTGAFAALLLANLATASPIDLARELADRLAAGAGALMPAADRVHVEEERIVPLDASWPADFLAGLVAEKRFGHEVFPVYARLDDATGAAVFYDADGLAFHEIEPLVPPADATTWLESLLGPASSPGDAWRELSHVVARFLLVPADDLEDYLADAAEDAALRARSAPRQRTGPPAVTNLMLTDISFTPTSVLVTAEWPAGSLPGNAFDLYLSQTLRKPGWRPYMAFAAPGQTNVTSFCTEIPNEDIPGWTDPATLHDASCPVATNVAVSPFDPAAAYTNVHYVCGHEMPQQSCFFVAGPTTDTDGDGLTDMEEAFCFGTDHELADSDNDGLGDFEEVCEYFTDPFSPDTDGDGSSDLFEIANGSDPRDPSDDGLPPAAWQLMTLPVRLYGDYAAWEMSVRGIQGELRTHTVVAAAPGVAEEDVLLLRRCATYRVSLRWLTSWPHVDPDWYCWEARFGNPLQPTGRTFADHSSQRLPGHETVWGEDWYCENAEGLLTTHVHTRDGTAGNVAQTKTAILHTLPEMPELAAPLAGVQCGSGRRVEMAVTERSWHPALEWEIYPAVANGPRLFATEDSTDPATFLTGPRSVWVSSGSVPGVYSILATYPGGAYSTEGHVVVPVVNINGDFLRNGTLFDDSQESFRVSFTNSFGIMIPCNNNDSNDDGNPDCMNFVLDGPMDVFDICPIEIAGLGLDDCDSNILSRISIRLIPYVDDFDSFPTIPFYQKFRIFPDTDSGTEEFGADLDGTGYELDGVPIEQNQVAHLFLEGLLNGASGCLKLEVCLDGNPVGDDTIRILVAPFVVNSNVEEASHVYLPGDSSFSAFKSSVSNAIEQICFQSEYGNGFIQDYAEIGSSLFQQNGEIQEQPTAWGFFADGFKSELGHDFGWFSHLVGGGHGGDIEALPAFPGWPYGRIIVGTKPAAAVSVFSSFFGSQEIQCFGSGLIEIPTDWLIVGHVDEIVSVIPKTNGFFVAVADLTTAIHALELDALDPDPEISTDAERLLSIYNNPTNQVRVGYIQSQLNLAVDIIASSLSVPTNEVIRIPVLLKLPQGDSLNYSLVRSERPNSINMVVISCNGRNPLAIVPDPLSPAMRQQIENQLTAPSGNAISVLFVNTSELTSGGGEAHCASNLIRKRIQNED